MHTDASREEIDRAAEAAWSTFSSYGKLSLRDRASLLRTIAQELEANSEELLKTATGETSLPQPRLQNELNRTLFQLRSYADAGERGEWLDLRIDTALPQRNPPRPDLRKMQIPLGPVVVFGASNFPFAYSTAGGDTATALMAGCPVIVKAHPAHAATSELAAAAISRAVRQRGLPDGVFAHLHGSSFESGRQLVTHPCIKAVGFTGSYAGGKALFDAANLRKDPIPVFAEMGSINPVFLLPHKLRESCAQTALLYAGSITLSVGQFCTNPGLLVGLDGEDLNGFIRELGEQIRHIAPGRMLHAGIAQAYRDKRSLALSQESVETVAVSAEPPREGEGIPTIASATAKAFLNNPILHQEVFGPYSLVIRCADMSEMLSVARRIEGQLTATLMATEADVQEQPDLMMALQEICGRMILNGVPTGVEVCLSMHHGGPFPATTDSRFTSVGADAIRRFARPMAFQNWPDILLPEELKDANPLRMWRTVNNLLTQEPAQRPNSA
jgi:alpha-ketoglutaric semialdehyde dehydrogenase